MCWVKCPLLKVISLTVLLVVQLSTIQGENDKAEKDGCKVCSCFYDDPKTLTFNCTRRHLENIITDWPEEFISPNNKKNVLMTFTANSITRISKLPPMTGSRVALSFNSNRLEEIDDAAFMNIQNIYFLDLGKNHLTGDAVRGEIFRGPYNIREYEPITLETLYLGYNYIHSLDKRIFEHTPNLTRLYLNNNQFEMLDHVTVLAIASATNLEILDLSYTDIDFIPVDMFRNMYKLHHLDLSGNQFSIVPGSLATLGHSLEFLTINNNPIEELNDESLLGLAKLKGLEISENSKLQKVSGGTFSELKSLRILHLCHNKNLHYISHNAFTMPTEKWSLKEVYLDNNKLSELPANLMPWDQLNVISLSGNSWLCDCNMADTINQKGVINKIPTNNIPKCLSPMKLSGLYITQIQPDKCPDTATDSLDSDYPKFHKIKPHKFTFKSIKLNHILLTIGGVTAVVVLGILLGLLTGIFRKGARTADKINPIKYININNQATA